MYIFTASHEKVELEYMETKLHEDGGRLAVRASGTDAIAHSRLTRAARQFFGLSTGVDFESSSKSIAEIVKKEPPLAVFREVQSGLLRMVHKELVIRFAPGASQQTQDLILKKHHLEVREVNPFVNSQVIVRSKNGKRTGVTLLELANNLMSDENVAFATPNFVSEFHRTAISIPIEQWHLKNTASVTGQKINEDVKAEGAWTITQGKSSIVIAVLDDGVDVGHPNLKAAIRKNPDPNEARDRLGRDFFVPPDNPEHFNPRPKVFQFPFNEMTGNDIHGTPCAGVIVAQGKNGGPMGIAPKCKLLAIKVFHGDALASDARVANAIRYASLHADILSCSWSSGASADIEAAINTDAANGRQGKGSAVFCASGNDSNTVVAAPARFLGAIAVGASTDQAKQASYSNSGAELSIVAPSSGGKQRIFTTDVSIADRGFNLGTASAGGDDGLSTNSFGGTSSATPLAAGVAALVLSVKPDLKRDELKALLEKTADKIGPASAYNSQGKSSKFGFGRINAERAVS